MANTSPHYSGLHLNEVQNLQTDFYFFREHSWSDLRQSMLEAV